MKDKEIHLVLQEFHQEEREIVNLGIGKGTLEEYYQLMIKCVNDIFNKIEDSSKGHEVNVGFIVFPSIKVVHDDENDGNPELDEARKQIMASSIAIKDIVIR